MNLRARVLITFAHPDIGFPVPDKSGMAVSHGGAVLQCEDNAKATLLCVLAQRDEQMLRTHAYWLVLLCATAGLADAEPWIASELRAAASGERRSVKVIEGFRLTLSVDHPPRTVLLQVEER